MIEFKDRMYGELHDELELYIQNRKAGSAEPADKASVLCNYIKSQKDSDIRLAIRNHRLELMKATQNRNNALCNYRIKLYRNDVLDFIEHNLKTLEKSGNKSELLMTLDASDETTLKGALDLCRENRCFRGRKLIENAGELIVKFQDGAGRKDPYIQLMAAFLDFRMGMLDKSSLLKTARTVYRANPKKYFVSDKIKALLCSSKDEDFSISNVIGELYSAILVCQAKAFLYDVGYTLKSSANDNVPADSRDSSNAKRKQNQILKLVDMYMAGQSSIDSFTDNGALSGYLYSESFKARCIKTHNTLDTLEKTNVLVPMFIDSMSGAGIFIIGKENVDSITYSGSMQAWKKGKEDFKKFNCHFAYMCWESVKNDESTAINAFVLLCGNNIDQAIAQFFEDNYEYDRFEVFRLINGDMPDDIDGCFEPFFESKISAESYERERIMDTKEKLANTEHTS